MYLDLLSVFNKAKSDEQNKICRLDYEYEYNMMTKLNLNVSLSGRKGIFLTSQYFQKYISPFNANK